MGFNSAFKGLMRMLPRQHKIHCVIEGESQSIKYKNNNPNLTMDRTWLSWEWCAQ